MTQVIVEGKDLTLNRRQVLGSGGEGTVYKVAVKGETVALKVYETPTKARAEKLLAFERLSPKFTDRVVAPGLIAFNPSGLAVGFTMPLLPRGFEELASLSNKRYRASYKVTTKDVVETFLDALPTLANEVHKQGFVVGDYNDLNILFAGSKVYFIDVDSWQFGKFPCPVATENFLDPMLYGVDLSKKPAFSPGNDWYSFAVMLFKSLLLVHPFGGTHKTLNRILARAQRKVTVFSPEVIYPGVALSPDILTDELAHAFDKYFTKNFREAFPKGVLEDYLSTLTKCKNCGSYFPAIRGVCPVCSAKFVVVIAKPIISGKTITAIELLRVNGQILFVQTFGDEVKVLAAEGGKIFFYNKKPNLVASRKELFREVKGARYEMTDEHLFVNTPGSASVLAYALTDGKLLGKVPTGIFAGNRKAVFKASENHFFRIDGVNLVYGEMWSGVLNEKPLRRVMEDQTWFWIDRNSETPSVFGVFQVIRQQLFWMVKEGNFFDVFVPELEKAESLIDISVKMSSKGVYILRRTQLAGKEYLRQELVDEGGKVTFSNRMPLAGHPFPNLHGQAYSNGVVLHPTDTGIVQEEVSTGKTKTFAETQGVAHEGDNLIRLGGSILVVKSDRIIELSAKS